MKNILSIDGGGMKGFAPAAMCTYIEQKTGKPLWQVFDGFAGTSIGGILACIYASGGSAADAEAFFTEDGPQIFAHTLDDLVDSGGIIAARYPSAVIEGVLQKRLGTATLADVKRPLLVTAMDLAQGSPYFFKSCGKETDFKLWEVARATSAAQTYFRAFHLRDKVLIDGGNETNNPAFCIYADAVQMWPGEQIRVLSLACAAGNTAMPAAELSTSDEWGAIENLKMTFQMLFAAGPDSADYFMEIFNPKGYTRCIPELGDSCTLDGVTPADISRLKASGANFVMKSGIVVDQYLAGV